MEQSIATNVEAEVNGAENMIYMSSKSSSDGRYVLTCTFKVGANLDLANVDINNRVNKATAKLPPEAINYGISVKKKSPDILLAISIYSPDNTFDDTFLSNYTSINLVDPIARIPGVGSTMIVGQRDYAMRFWVRPDKLAKLGLTGSDLANVIGEQNLVAPAGQVGQPPAKAGTQFQYTVNVKGRLTDASEFENMIVRTQSDGSILRMKDVSRAELSGKSYTSFGRKDGIPATVLIIYQLPGANAIQTVDSVRKMLDETRKDTAAGARLSHLAGHHRVRQSRHSRGLPGPAGRHRPRADCGLHLPRQHPRDVHPHAGRSRLAGRNLRRFRDAGIFHQYADDAGGRACGGHRGRRRDRGRRSRGTPHRARSHPGQATEKAMEEVSGPVVAIGLVLCAVFVPVSFMGGITGQLYKQFAITDFDLRDPVGDCRSHPDSGAVQHDAASRARKSAVRSARFSAVSTRSSTRLRTGISAASASLSSGLPIGLACLAALWFGAGSLAHAAPERLRSE